MVGKREVGLSSICYDVGSWANMSLDYRDVGVVVSVVVFTLY